jgi:hypothetical protein
MTGVTVSTASILDNSVTARWLRSLTGEKPDEKRHWRTRTSYYRALAGLIDGGEPSLPWHRVVHAVQPKGSRSTFYEVAGSRGRYPLLGALVADGSTESIQVALCYERPGAVQRLIDETKVWDFWPHRASLLARYRGQPGLDGTAAVASAAAEHGPSRGRAEASPPRLAESLVSAVAQWAYRRPSLAEALDHAPPVCAVEDLLLVHRGRLSATGAVAILRQAMKEASGCARSGVRACQEVAA